MTLSGQVDRKIILLAADGVHENEVISIRERTSAAGMNLVIASLTGASLQSVNGLDKGQLLEPDMAVDQVKPEDYDALVIPDGLYSVDALRGNTLVIEIVAKFLEEGKPLGVIGHAPWILIESGLITNRSLSSWHTLRVDILNAGGHWVKAPVHNDMALVSTASSDYLEEFLDRFISEVQSGVHTSRGAAPGKDKVLESSEESFPASDAPGWVSSSEREES